MKWPGTMQHCEERLESRSSLLGAQGEEFRQKWQAAGRVAQEEAVAGVRENCHSAFDELSATPKVTASTSSKEIMEDLAHFVTLPVFESE